jgi:hypothetical protein
MARLESNFLCNDAGKWLPDSAISPGVFLTNSEGCYDGEDECTIEFSPEQELISNEFAGTNNTEIIVNDESSQDKALVCRCNLANQIR